MSDPDGNSVSAASDGPQTFDQAFAADVSSASDPASSSPPAVAAVTPPSETGSRQSPDDDRSPFIPRQRFDEVNTQLRDLKQWRESRPWAESLDGQTFDTVRQWYLRAQTDPRAFAFTFLDELLASADHAPGVRSELARRLGSRPSGSPTVPEPDVEITNAQGQVVGRTYSDARLAERDAFREQQLLAQLDQRYADRFKTLDEIKTEKQGLEARRQSEAFASSCVSELSSLPLFEAHKAEIGAAIKAMRLASDDPEAVRVAAFRAYHQVVGPKLASGQTSQVLADLQRKGQARGINPAASVTSTPKSPRSFHDPALSWT